MNRREFFNLARKVGIVSASTMVPWKLLQSVGAVEEWYQEQAHAAALPQNYLLSHGTAVVDTSLGVAGIASQAVNAGDATWVVEEVTDDAYLWPRTSLKPSKVLRVRVATPGTVTSSYDINWTVSIVPNVTHNLSVIFRGENLGTVSQGVVIFLAQDATLARYYQWNNVQRGFDEAKIWKPQTLLISSPSQTSGTPPTPTTTHTVIKMRCAANAGESPSYYICPVYANVQAKPQITVVLDDGYSTDYTAAYPYMQARGIVGSCAVDMTGSPNMTVPQMLEMQAAGWSMHNHTANHTNLSTITAAEIRVELETCRSYLRTNGLDSGRSVFVLPFGSRNATVDATVAEYYPYTAVSDAGEYNGTPIWFGFPNPSQIDRVSMDVPTSSSTTIGRINAAVARGNSMIVYGHNPTTGAVSGNLDVDTFKPIMDHLYRLKSVGAVGNPNLEQLFTRRENPRRMR